MCAWFGWALNFHRLSVTNHRGNQIQYFLLMISLSTFCSLVSHPDQVEEKSFPNFDSFRAEIEHFVDCIETGAIPLADGHSGMKAVAICRAVKQSSATGMPIEL